jgi:hypothetical protein
LEALERTGVVAYACEQADVDRLTVYKERQRNEEFALAWADSEERGTELLEAEARRRAAIGVDRPVFYKGKEVGQVREYSDQLLMFLLRARRPEVFRENVQVDHTGRVEHGLPILGGRQPVDVPPATRALTVGTPTARARAGSEWHVLLVPAPLRKSKSQTGPGVRAGP